MRRTGLLPAHGCGEVMLAWLQFDMQPIFAIMEEITPQCMGRGLTSHSAGRRDDGCIMVNVSGPMGLVALARMCALEAD